MCVELVWPVELMFCEEEMMGRWDWIWIWIWVWDVMRIGT